MGNRKKCFQYIRSKTDLLPVVGVTLGSGLGAFAEHIDCRADIPYAAIPGFPVSTVEGHKGRFIIGYLDQIPVIVMQGRIHYYEGYSMEDVVLPIRIMRMLGIKSLVLTNAAGSINPDIKVGDFMLIKDHIGNFVPSPLRGTNCDLGIRFPDMTNIYCRQHQDKARLAAVDSKILLKEGTYLQTSGPQFETPAENKMYRMFGADAVGMSTACEATAAIHAGIRVCGISCITNLASGLSTEPQSVGEVTETTDRVKSDFHSFISSLILKIGEEELL